MNKSPLDTPNSQPRSKQKLKKHQEKLVNAETKCKVFVSKDSDDIESKVEDLLEDEETLKVVDKDFTATDGVFAVFLIYLKES